MASSFARSARQGFRAGANAFRAQSAPRPSFPKPSRGNIRSASNNIRSRFLRTAVPLHDAVAAAKLVSHLSTSSRSRSALSLGLVVPWGKESTILLDQTFALSWGSFTSCWPKGSTDWACDSVGIATKLIQLKSKYCSKELQTESLGTGLQGYVDVCFNMLRNFKGAVTFCV